MELGANDLPVPKKEWEGTKRAHPGFPPLDYSNKERSMTSESSTAETEFNTGYT